MKRGIRNDTDPQRYVKCTALVNSVADSVCLSRILIFVHPGYPISDPKTATKEKDEKKFVVLTFFVATNITKLKII
jgi:hypothetical protein